MHHLPQHWAKERRAHHTLVQFKLWKLKVFQNTSDIWDRVWGEKTAYLLP